MAKKGETFHNLIDKMAMLSEEPALNKKPGEMFRRLLSDYFFNAIIK